MIFIFDVFCIYFAQIRILIEKVFSNEPSQKVNKFMHIFKIKIELQGVY